MSPVFIDKSNLIKIESLKDALQDNLENLKYLILICSPNSAKSEYVNDEVEYFIKNGRLGSIVPVIIAGEPHSKEPSMKCFPPAILNLPRGLEPLGVDFRKRGWNASHNAFSRLVAALLGLNPNNFKAEEAL